jgi:hypothetical protein
MTSVTAAQCTPRLLTIYLRRATWGLPAARRHELWDELEEHLLTRADHLHAFGTAYDQALAQAIAELGPPAKVSAAMTEVYLMPKLLIAAATCALALSAVFVVGAIGKTQTAASVFCHGSPSFCDLWVNLDELLPTLKAQGVTVKNAKTGGGYDLTFPGTAHGSLTLPSLYSGQAERGAPVSSILDSLQNMEAAQISGFAKPVFKVGATELQLVTKNSVPVGEAIYQMLTGIALSDWYRAYSQDSSEFSFWFDLSPFASTNPSLFKHLVATGQEPGSVMLLTTMKAAGVMYCAIAPVDAKGNAVFYLPKPQLSFVDDFKKITPYLAGGRSPATLHRFTGQIGRSASKPYLVLVTPAHPTSDTVK